MELCNGRFFFLLMLINSDVLGQGKKKTQKKRILPAEIGPKEWVVSLLNLSPASSDPNGEAGF